MSNPLPLELILQILEDLAWISDRLRCLELMLLSKSTYSAAASAFYHSVALRTQQEALDFFRTAERRDAGSCAGRVRILSAPVPWSAQIYHLFPNLDHLHLCHRLSFKKPRRRLFNFKGRQNDIPEAAVCAVRPPPGGRTSRYHLQATQVEDGRAASYDDQYGRGTVLAYLVTLPLPAETQQVCDVAFTIKSHDQGWSTHSNDHNGTYQCSRTWFETAIIRTDDPSVQALSGSSSTYVHAPDGNSSERLLRGEVKSSNGSTRWLVVPNLRAVDDSTVHHVKWGRADPCSSKHLLHSDYQDDDSRIQVGADSHYSEFVRELKAGDRVVLFARAEFGGWVNQVEQASVDIYYE